MDCPVSVDPDDVRGMKVRGGSREVDMILKEAGASVVTLPSNEIYAAMQTGAMDAAMTSSTSLISFRLEEVSKALTTGRAGAYWFIDIVGTEIHPMNLEFAVVKLVSKDGAGSVVVEDGNGNTSWEKKIEFTDCPEGVWSFYLVDGTLLLPSEY